VGGRRGVERTKAACLVLLEGCRQCVLKWRGDALKDFLLVILKQKSLKNQKQRQRHSTLRSSPPPSSLLPAQDPGTTLAPPRTQTQNTVDMENSAAASVAARPELWAIIAQHSGQRGAARLMGVCRASRIGAKVWLRTLPGLVVCGGTG
jgi:hypothetical protein